MTEQINYYQFIKDRLDNRPYNEHRRLDGKYNFIHQTDAFDIVKEVGRLRDKVKDLENKLARYKDKSVITGAILDGVAYCVKCCENGDDKEQWIIHDEYQVITHTDQTVNEINCDECSKVIETIVKGDRNDTK